MPALDIAALKAQQDAFLARRAALLDRFVPFWNGLIERLTAFTSDALAAGLVDVRECHLRPNYGETGVAEVMLNGFNLLLVATDETNHLDAPNGPIAARVLIYPHDQPDAQPTGDFLARELNGETYQVQGRFFGVEQNRAFFSGDVSLEHGREAADALIRLIYSLHLLWEERPMLGIALDRDTPTGSIGFRPPSSNGPE
ncbi:MAG TPA: hypothetical protein VFU22_22810 [Roseiflexaceae bacterium]|nr:hypothetical protein [Roseiflexaceae bacterium]